MVLFSGNGIISKKRNQPSNRKFHPSLKTQILKLMNNKYQDFGPTLAAEKLLEHEGIHISHETLRNWMVETHLWIPKVKKRRIHLLIPFPENNITF